MMVISEIGPFDDEMPGGQPPISSQVENCQVSVFELFALMTFVALGVGVFLYVSSLLALLSGGLVIYAAVLRLSDCRNLLAGGFVGFLTAAVVTAIILLLGNFDGTLAVGLAIFCPPAGYVFGAISAELGKDAM